MPEIPSRNCDDLPYGPGQTDYEYDKLRQERDDAQPERLTNRELAEALDQCKLIVVDHGAFSSFTGKCAVSTKLLNQVVEALRTSIPKSLADALRDWSGFEPSQSALAREVDKWKESLK